MSSSWPSWESSGSMAFDGTQDPPASASGAPVQTEMAVAPNSVHLLHFLIREMQRDIAGRATKDDLDGLRDLVEWQVAALSDMSIRGQQQVDKLSARVRELETGSRCSSVVLAGKTENTTLVDATDVEVSRTQRESRFDGLPDLKLKGELPPSMPLWPVIASPVVFVQDSWPHASCSGAIGSHLPHGGMVGSTGEWAQSAGNSCSMDSLLKKEMASLEVLLYELCDDDPIIVKESLSEARDLPLSVVQDTADSGVESGQDTFEPSLTPMEVRDFYPPVPGGKQENENHLQLIRSVGHRIVHFAVRMVGSLFCGQSF